MHPSKLSIAEFSYHLPEEKIALHPLPQRDASKLLIYREGEITESRFAHIADLLPQNALLVFNKTKVINARIRFKKESGAAIEIFCLEPEGQITEYNTVMRATGSVRWKCFVGGAAKWKNETLEKKVNAAGTELLLRARMLHKQGDAYSIELSWSPSDADFATVISAAGDVPLPPYIKRAAVDLDERRYQTVFAENEGSVAAPTAGLHFTEDIFRELAIKSIRRDFVTLHVGAGTFKPVKSETMAGHEMHAEYIDVEKSFIQRLAENRGPVAAVGTTSVRTVESLYWLGVKAHLQPTAKKLTLSQWDIYDEPLSSIFISRAQAFTALYQWLESNKLENLFTHTQLLISPGYRFRVAEQLITNFHQPQSTLLLLVAAAIGADWKLMYKYALEHDFRFLSYGDSNLIFINDGAMEKQP